MLESAEFPLVARVDDAALYRDQSFVHIQRLFSSRLLSALDEEANQTLSDALRPRKGWRTDGGTKLRDTPAFQSDASSSPLLEATQSKLIPFIQSLTGKLLAPAFAWYNYYQENDGIWLHVDPPESEVSVLVRISGEIGPLHLHPSLKGKSQDELDHLFQNNAWDENDGNRIAYEKGSAIINRGHIVPHHRPAKPIKKMGIVAAIHYRKWP